MEERRLSGAAPRGAHRPRGPRGEIRIVADAGELTRVAAEEVVKALAGLARPARARVGTPSTSASPSARLASSAAAPAGLPAPAFALSGGSTPRALYRLLSDPAAPFRDRIAWETIHFFWGDERHVPPDHPDSNFRMAREAMLERVPVPAAHVHRIPSEEPDAARAAALYERELIDVFDLVADRDGAASAAELDWPRFDLVLLGLGEEGHTASLFPGSPLLAESRHLVAAVWVASHQAWRITLTPPVLDHAATVIFLVSGAAKAAALAAVVEGKRRPALYPAQMVAPVDGRLLWLVDEDAAAQLRQRRGRPSS
jgi:6-phosphogluconolactonase